MFLFDRRRHTVRHIHIRIIMGLLVLLLLVRRTLSQILNGSNEQGLYLTMIGVLRMLEDIPPMMSTAIPGAASIRSPSDQKLSPYIYRRAPLWIVDILWPLIERQIESEPYLHSSDQPLSVIHE